MEEQNEKIKQYVAQYKDEMMAFWKELVNYQAGSKEAERMADLLKRVGLRLEREGFEWQLLPTGCPIPMLQAYLGKDRPGKPILLTGHLDTVFPNGSYPENPFREEDGKVYGPGTCDMKGGVVMMLYVVKVLEKLGYREHPIKFVLVGDEETTHVGSRVPEMLAEEARECLCAFNMETGRTNHVLTVARKGCMDVWVTTHGKAGHVGNAYRESANALEAMCGIVLKMRALTDLDQGIIVSTDVISAGTASNSIPDQCRIEADCRVDRNADLVMLKEKISEICRKTDVPGTTAEVVFPAEMPVFEKTGGNLKLLDLYNASAEEFGIAPFGPFHPGGCSDASFLAQAGIPILDSLGPEGEQEHTLHEFAYVDTLLSRTAMLTSTILKLNQL